MSIFHLQSPRSESTRPVKHESPVYRRTSAIRANVMVLMLQDKWRLIKENCRLLYPMVFCNPVLILHFVNGLLSFLQPNTVYDPTFDTWINPHLDVHADDEICKVFTVLVVVLQLAVYRPSLDNGDDTPNDGG
ncbi:hypothetical protein A1O3_02761 [Capronia epimyces CBS 606.96]|uniref:Uncharacterized protein n=1 Tax=Capronia epimyces CBS 606.96 TaxID=1182542 RepID=W9Z5B9_9EURO|nr:uncharacterized protein A1O3_02761 [Capronia epimyces CBS 606.96]EXJ89694.1 hypothetical protein A1O3_02761 [Capronia epimyces CBS 606.96]